MPGLDPARLRKLADELEEEEAALQREAASAKDAEDREAARSELEQLREEIADLKDQLAQAATRPHTETETEADPGHEGEPDEVRRRRRTRPGRKRGMVYLDDKTGLGVVYGGEDEPDRVPLDDEDEGEAEAS